MYERFRVEAVFDPATPVERVYSHYREIRVPVCEQQADRERAIVAAVKKATGVRVTKHREGFYGRKRERSGGAQSFTLHRIEA